MFFYCSRWNEPIEHVFERLWAPWNRVCFNHKCIHKQSFVCLHIANMWTNFPQTYFRIYCMNSTFNKCMYILAIVTMRCIRAFFSTDWLKLNTSLADFHQSCEQSAYVSFTAPHMLRANAYVSFTAPHAFRALFQCLWCKHNWKVLMKVLPVHYRANNYINFSEWRLSGLLN